MASIVYAISLSLWAMLFMWTVMLLLDFIAFVLFPGVKWSWEPSTPWGTCGWLWLPVFLFPATLILWPLWKGIARIGAEAISYLFLILVFFGLRGSEDLRAILPLISLLTALVSSVLLVLVYRTHFLRRDLVDS